MHANYFRIGGVHQDLPPKLLDDIWAFCDPFLKVCDDIEGLLTENRIFKQRNVGIGAPGTSSALLWHEIARTERRDLPVWAAQPSRTRPPPKPAIACTS